MNTVPGKPALVVAVWVLSTAAVLGLPFVVSAEPGDPLIRNTIRLSLVFYFAAAVVMLRLPGSSAPDWSAATTAGRLARALWTGAWAEYIVHLAMAMHFYHGWSHAHAVEHTRQVTGFGEGIYFSHAFSLLWTADVLWWWANPAGYAARSPWLGRALHGYMTFIIFNGTVVWEEGPIRWAAAAGYAVLGALWLGRISAPASAPERQSPASRCRES